MQHAVLVSHAATSNADDLRLSPVIIVCAALVRLLLKGSEHTWSNHSVDTSHLSLRFKPLY